jgi:hypothetical protein
MALFKPKQLYSAWRVKSFPRQLKEEFKQRCSDEKVAMVAVLRKLVRDYVNETQDMFENNTYKRTQIDYYGGDKVILATSSFPSKLKADFKSCCATRGDKITEATIYIIEKYLSKGDDDGE